jgi:hypothetical protein
MRKSVTLGLLLSAVLFTTPASAQVASTSIKGSVLKFPLIDIQSEDTRTTIVHISNDGNSAVNVKCYYMNEAKGRRDFAFKLTPKQTVTWDVYTHSGTINVAAFPANAVPGFANFRTDIGELTCFAVNSAGSQQTRWNHLSGTATVVYFNDGDASQPRQAFTYNAWAFRARPGVAEGAPVGVAGTILLDGVEYDGCPGYLITEFSPAGATLATGRGDVTFLDSNLSVVSCKEDLRQDFTPHFTKLQFNVWNAQETKFTGAYVCANSFRELGLDTVDAPPDFVAPENFTYGVLGTTDARFQVSGVASTQCPFFTENTGLLGVLTSSVQIAPDTSESTETATTLRAVGSDLTGFILWDPQPDVVPEKSQ